MSDKYDPSKKKDNYRGNDKKKENQLSNYVFGKVQPQALPLEEAVLGAVMLDKDALSIVLDILRPESFYKDAHTLIYKAMLRLFEKTQPVDLLTVTEELKKSGDIEKVGGPYYLVELTNRVASAANIEYHARIIAQKHIQRELITVSTKIIRDAYEDTTDVFSLLDEAEQGLFNITQQNLSRGYESMGSLAAKALKQLEEMSQKEEGLTGVPTGFTELDRLTSGWQPSDMIIVAARPGMGKTSYTLALARNAAVDFNKPVAIFSLEMSNLQLVQRLISMEAEISGSKLRSGQLEDYEWQQLQSAIEKMSEVPIFIDDTPGINIFELRAKCRRLKMQHDIQMVIIDYLQLMTGGGESGKGNREQEISMISRSLKALAKELSVPVIALSQLSRAVETRGGSKRPMLSDLRECITGDSLIYMADTGDYQRVDSLVGKSNFQVLAMNDEFKLEPATCLDVWETGDKEVYEVETQSGIKIKASLNHPFYSINGWEQLVDLKEGDYIASSRVIESPTSSELKDEEIILLAHMIGDGCYVERQPIHYTSQEKDALTVVADAAKKLWNIESRLVKDVSSKNCYHLYLPSPYHLTHGVRHPFSNLLLKVGLKKARSFEKSIPSLIFKSSKQQIALFLKHIWSTDGGVFIRKGKGGSKVHYASNSFELITGIKSLLLRFGIQSSIQKTQKLNYRPGYNLSITGKKDIGLFAKYVGIFGSKSKILDQLMVLFNDVKHNTNTDIIPKNIWETIKIEKKKAGFTERSFQSAINTNYCGSSLYRSNLSRERLSRVSSVLENTSLSSLAQSDLKWEKIKSITHIGTEKTYDLHVEGLHNFVANNFIVHNSGAIEQDADIVSFIYRPEYYQILEDEEGQSLKGVAEIIVAKHRNGALKTVKLKFTDQFAKFSDLDDPDFSGLIDDAGAGANPAIITRSSKMNNDDIPF